MITTIAAARREYMAGLSGPYRNYAESYKSNGFGVWLSVRLTRLAVQACEEVDRENRLFTLSEVKGLVRLYAESVPYNYLFLEKGRRPKATAKGKLYWVANLNGYGPDATVVEFRNRLPIEYGILTEEFWS